MPMDRATLDRELDKVKLKVFMNKDAAFLGPLLGSLNFYWTDKIKTCATDYTSIMWNPKDFEECTPDERISSLLHELAHNYMLHGVRQGTRDQKLWNYACDIVIARQQVKSGYVLGPTWIQPMVKEVPPELEEQIYDFLKQHAKKVPQPGGGANGAGSCSCHQLPAPSKQQLQTAVQNVVRAIQQAKMSGQPGAIPGNLETLLDKFLKPKIKWESLIYQWFNDKLSFFRSFRRPNRRYQAHGQLMKSWFRDEDRLGHLLYYFDVSGSTSDQMVTRFNSELKYIFDVFQPQKITLCLFDTRITRTFEYKHGEKFPPLKVNGRGGTDLAPVREHIMAQKDATAAIIFSDMYCAPMEPGPKIPILWIACGNPGSTVPFGKIIHIEEN